MHLNIRRHARDLFVFGALAIIPLSANAQTVIQRRFGTSGSWTTIEPNFNTIPAVTISLAGLSSGTWYYRIFNLGATNPLGFISFENFDVNRNIVLIVADVNDLASNQLTPGIAHDPGCGTFYGAERIGAGYFTVQASFSGSLLKHPSNSVGSIIADWVVRVDAGGDINEPITQYAGDNTSPTLAAVNCTNLNGGVFALRGVVDAVQASNDIGVNGGVATGDGNITSVIVGNDMRGFIDATAAISSNTRNVGSVTVGRDLRGTIHANDGGIGNVNVAGVVDAPNTTGGLAAIRSRDGLNRLITKSVSAQTSIGLVAGGGPGKLGLLKTTDGGFAGTLIAKSLEPPTGGGESGINILGNLTGTLRFQAGGGPQTETIKILGSLGGGSPITGTIQYDGATDLTNQIIINTLGVTDGAWLGTVMVGSTTLSPKPSYDQLPSSFGGGAVGLSHFTFHPKASVPQHMAVLSTSPATAVIDHYGPVINTDDPAVPIRVDRRQAGSTNENDFVNVTNLFQVQTVESAYPFRRVTVAPSPPAMNFGNGYEYRLRPVIADQQTGMTRLKGRYDSNTVGVQIYDYRFTIINPLDIDGDGDVDTQDVALWPPNPKDFNADTVADVTDFCILVNAAGSP
ncbi:MAG: hypothetical protein ACKVW3_06835 [Phycisphaerales bacterium]